MLLVCNLIWMEDQWVAIFNLFLTKHTKLLYLPMRPMGKHVEKDNCFVCLVKKWLKIKQTPSYTGSSRWTRKSGSNPTTGNLWSTKHTWSVPSDSNNEPKHYLTEVAKEWGRKIAGSQLESAAAEYCLYNIVYCKLFYPLAATMLSQSLCTEILIPLLAAGLPVVGY